MTSPLLTPAQAAVLLDRVVLDRVAACIDLEHLQGVETMLGALMLDVQGIEPPLAVAAARAMVHHALRRIADEPSVLDHLAYDNNVCRLCDADDQQVAALTSRGEDP